MGPTNSQAFSLGFVRSPRWGSDGTPPLRAAAGLSPALRAIRKTRQNRETQGSQLGPGRIARATAGPAEISTSPGIRIGSTRCRDGARRPGSAGGTACARALRLEGPNSRSALPVPLDQGRLATEDCGLEPAERQEFCRGAKSRAQVHGEADPVHHPLQRRAAVAPVHGKGQGLLPGLQGIQGPAGVRGNAGIRRHHHGSVLPPQRLAHHRPARQSGHGARLLRKHRARRIRLPR